MTLKSRSIDLFRTFRVPLKHGAVTKYRSHDVSFELRYIILIGKYINVQKRADELDSLRKLFFIFPIFATYFV